MTDTTDDLNKSLASVNDKARQLNDSLKALASEGLDALSRNAAAGSRSSGSTRQSAGDVTLQSLSSLLKQEVGDSLSQLFGGGTNAASKALGAGGQGGGFSVVINNNTSASVTAAETTDSFDQKTLEITIDQMVANSLLRGRQTSGVLRTLFGIVPSLIGR